MSTLETPITVSTPKEATAKAEPEALVARSAEEAGRSLPAAAVEDGEDVAAGLDSVVRPHYDYH